MFANTGSSIVSSSGFEWVDADGNNSLDIVNDDELMEFFYNEDYYCYTEWTKFDIDDVYYDAEGNEYEKQ